MEPNTYEFDQFRFNIPVTPRVYDAKPPGAIGFDTSAMPPKSPRLKGTSIYQSSISDGENQTPKMISKPVIMITAPASPIQTAFIPEDLAIPISLQTYSSERSTMSDKNNRRLSDFIYSNQQNIEDNEVEIIDDADSEEISLYSPVEILEENLNDNELKFSKHLIPRHDIYDQDALLQEDPKRLNPPLIYSSSDSDEYDTSNYQQSIPIPEDFPQSMSVKQPKTLLQYILFQQHNKKLEQLSLQNINPPSEPAEPPKTTMEVQNERRGGRPRTPEPPDTTLDADNDDGDEISYHGSRISLFDDPRSLLGRDSYDYPSTSPSPSPSPTQNMLGLLNASDDPDVQWWSESDSDDDLGPEVIDSVSFTDDIFNEYLPYTSEEADEDLVSEDPTSPLPLQRMQRICAFCEEPIEIGAVLLVGRWWHQDHSRCAECFRSVDDAPGVESQPAHFAEIDGLVYCEDHYFVLRGQYHVKRERVIETELREIKASQTVRRVRNLMNFEKTIRLQVVTADPDTIRVRHVKSQSVDLSGSPLPDIVIPRRFISSWAVKNTSDGYRNSVA
ncbi:hypothetical protein HK096_004613, partial [Nowakowskiella sp. JEL0078]